MQVISVYSVDPLADSSAAATSSNDDDEACAYGSTSSTVSVSEEPCMHAGPAGLLSHSPTHTPTALHLCPVVSAFPALEAGPPPSMESHTCCLPACLQLHVESGQTVYAKVSGSSVYGPGAINFLATCSIYTQ